MRFIASEFTLFMKRKIIFWSFVAAGTLLFVATGCKDKDNTPLTPKQGPDLTLTLQAGDANGANTDRSVLLTATAPEAVSGMYKIMPTMDYNVAVANRTSDTELVEGGSVITPGKLGQTLSDNIKGIVASNLLTETPFTAIVEVMGADNGTTLKSISVTTTKGDGPEMTPVLVAGDMEQLHADTAVMLTVTAPNAVSGHYVILPWTNARKELDGGKTYDDLVASGEPLTSDTATIVKRGLTPETTYMAIVQATGANDATTMKIAEATTQARIKAPELSLVLTAGDAEGTNKETTLSLRVSSRDAVSGTYAIMPTSDYDSAIAGGAIDEDFVSDSNGIALDPDVLKGAPNTVISGLRSDTAYTAIVRVIGANRGVAVATVTPNSPDIKVDLAAGDGKGENKDTTLCLKVTAPDAVSGMYVIMPTADYQAAMKQGATNQDLVANGNGITLDPNVLTGETATVVSGLVPQTSYTVIVQIMGLYRAISVTFASATTFGNSND